MIRPQAPSFGSRGNCRDGSIVPIVSIPPFVTPPHSVTHTTVAAGRGDFAVLRADPIRSHRRRPAPSGPGCCSSPDSRGAKDFIAVLLLQDAGIAAATYDQLGQFETPRTR